MLFAKIHNFINDSKRSGILSNPEKAEACYRALLQIDWTDENVFYTTLCCPLLKKASLKKTFDELCQQLFHAIYPK